MNTHKLRDQNTYNLFRNKYFKISSNLAFIFSLLAEIFATIQFCAYICSFGIDYYRFWLVLIFPLLGSIYINKCGMKLGLNFNVIRFLFKKTTDNGIDFFNAKYSYLYYLTFAFCFFQIFHSIAYFSNGIKIFINKSVSNPDAYLALSALTAIFLVANAITNIQYSIAWKKIFRWDYNELYLSNDDKKAILKNEKECYKTFKDQQKALKKQKKAIHKTSKNKFKIPKYNKKPTSMTKLDKLKELKDLLDNEIISQDEYEKAREEILGK